MRILLLLSSLGILASLSSAAHAEAGVAFGVEINGSHRIENDAKLTLGSGGSVRLGYQFENGLTPQVLATAGFWSGADKGVDYSSLAAAGLIGLRWNVIPSFRAPVQPWLALNVGGGILHDSVAQVSQSEPGIALTTGVGIDFPLTPLGVSGLALGTHLTYNKIVVDTAPNGQQIGTTWIVIGADLSFVIEGR